MSWAHVVSNHSVRASCDSLMTLARSGVMPRTFNDHLPWRFFKTKLASPSVASTSVSLRARYVNCVPRWLPMTAPGTVARYTTPVGAATSNATPLTVGSMSAEV